MFIDICEIKGKYRGADRDINMNLFCLTGNSKLDYELYCNFCNYDLEFNGEEKILNNRLNLLRKLCNKNNNVELIIYDEKPITKFNNFQFFGFDVLNEFFESPLSYEKGTFFIDNLLLLNDYSLFQHYSDARNSLINNPFDQAGHLLNIFYIYGYSIL